jgi:hypothetical protein
MLAVTEDADDVVLVVADASDVRKTPLAVAGRVFVGVVTASSVW